MGGGALGHHGGLRAQLHRERDLGAEFAAGHLADLLGQTALMLAAGRNFLGAVKQLIAARADLTKVAKSRITALGFAQEKGHTEAAKLLKNAGASS